MECMMKVEDQEQSLELHHKKKYAQKRSHLSHLTPKEWDDG